MTVMIGSGRAQTKCDQCGQWDDHPKVVHSVMGDPSVAGHPHDWRRHHDCVPYDVKLGIIAGAHSQHALLTAKIFDAAEKGTRGGDLLEVITSQQMKDYGDAQMMAGGVDQTMANATLTAWLPTSGTATVGTVTVTAPIKARFDSAMGSDTAAATEWSTSGGYTAGGVSVGSNWSAASAGARAASATISVTNAPAQTWAGNELWDSSGTPLRVLWGPLSGGNKTVNSGDTASLTSLSGTLA